MIPFQLSWVEFYGRLTSRIADARCPDPSEDVFRFYKRTNNFIGRLSICLGFFLGGGGEIDALISLCTEIRSMINLPGMHPLTTSCFLST